MTAPPLTLDRKRRWPPACSSRFFQPRLAATFRTANRTRERSVTITEHRSFA